MLGAFKVVAENDSTEIDGSEIGDGEGDRLGSSTAGDGEELGRWC